MQICISLLRGVNMSGHNTIKMTDLAELYNNLGFRDPETYIQSGNVIFNIPGNQSLQLLPALIEEAILKKFNYKIPVMIRTLNELKETLSVNLFKDEENFNEDKLSVIFLNEFPQQAQIEKVKSIDYPPDKFKIVGREVFIYCPNGFGKTKLYTSFFEKKMTLTGTARNWNTVNKIFELALKRS